MKDAFSRLHGDLDYFMLLLFRDMLLKVTAPIVPLGS